ncbi:MAG TPA: hypothetical protein IAC03_00635 [Candidatus Coprenecus pullistercoris]|nr:hypothetical protein [Candidatus Coprenecus pullistercoris]
MKRFFLFTALAAALLTGCNSNEKEPSQNEPRIIFDIQGNLTVNAEGGQNSVKYRIDNPVEGGKVDAVSQQTWAGDFTCTDSVITFNVEPNTASGNRSSIITVTYTYSGDMTVQNTLNLIQRGIKVYDHDFEASTFTGTYENVDDQYHMFTVILSDPYNADGTARPGSSYYTFYLYTKAPENLADPVLYSGTYSVGQEGDTSPMIISSTSSVIAFDDNGETSLDAKFIDGTMIVSQNGSDFSFDADLTDENGDTHHVVYEGPVSFVTIKDGMQILYQDIDLKAKTATPQCLTVSTMNVMEAYLHLTDMTASGSQLTGPGSVLRVHSYMPFDRTGGIAAGTYTIKEPTPNTNNQGCLLAGYISEKDNKPYGTFLQYIDARGYVYVGIITEGTMKVTANGSSYSIECNFTTAEGQTIKGTYSGQLATWVDDDRLMKAYSTLSGNRIIQMPDPESNEYFDLRADYHGFRYNTEGAYWMVYIMSQTPNYGLQIELVSNTSSISEGIATGTYKAALGFPSPGEYLTGTLDYWGSFIGTNFLENHDGTGFNSYAPAVSGDLNITNNGNNNYTISFDFLDDKGNTWRYEGEWTGTLPVSDKSQPNT